MYKILYLQCLALYKEQKFNEAIDNLNRIIESFGKKEVSNANEQLSIHDQLKFQASVHHTKADICIDINKINESDYNYKKSLQLLTQLDQSQSDVILEIGFIYAKLGKQEFFKCQYRLSFEYLNKAQVLLEDQYQQSNEYSYTLLQLGNYYRFMFEDEKSESLIKKSISIRNELFGSFSYELAECFHTYAQYLADTGYLSQAKLTINQGIEILTKINPFSLRRAKMLYLLSNLLLRDEKQKEDHIKAEKLINEALEINIKLVGFNFPDTADCYNALGRLHSLNKDQQNFVEYYDKAIQILISVYGNIHGSLAIVYNNLGKAYLDRKMYENSCQVFNKSIIIYKSLCGNNHGNLAITYRNCGDCNKHLGRLKIANFYYREAQRIYQNINNGSHSDSCEYLKKAIQNTETED